MRHFKKPRLGAVVPCLLLLCIAGSTVAKTIEIPLGDATFSNPTIIDNPYWPLTIGNTYAYRAETEDGCEYNKLIVTAVPKTVKIDGTFYTTLIVRDQEWESEDCIVSTATLGEDTRDFYAQDDDGNIWYFGEDSWAIDEESLIPLCTDDGSWVAGVDDAEPGVLMLANPTSGDRYQQEYWEDEAEDWGAVLRLNANVSIEYGDFEACLMTREWTPLEPGEIEHKFYCPEPGDPGPGLMFIEELKGKTVNVEFIGMDFSGIDGGGPAPGELLPFPALQAVGSCTMPP